MSDLFEILKSLPEDKLLKVIDAMPEGQREHLLEIADEYANSVKRERGQQEFLTFVKTMWPNFISGRHHAVMARAFERVAKGELKRLIICMPPRHRLSLDTEIPTTQGWKTIRDIQAGDYVFAPDGKPVLVTGKSDVYHERLYEVTSIDGHKVRCDGEHLWTVRFQSKFHTYSTEQLWRRECGEHLCTTSNGRVVFRGVRKETSENRPAILPVNHAVEYPRQELLVDPYVLGVWLGDGTKHCGVITSHDDDAIFIRGEFERRGYVTTDQATKYTFGVLDLKVNLRAIGVLNNKHIPASYLTASKEQRVDLLRGLMDSDGNVSKDGQCMFSQKSREFIEQVRELLNSLGVKNTFHSSEAKIGDRSYGTTYRLSFYMKDCCSLPRKACRTFNPLEKNKARSVRFERLDEYGDVQCLQVANEDGLFLIGRGYLTGHNTKSEFASYLLPAWFLGKYPDKKIIQCSNTAELAVGFGRKVRNLVDGETYTKIFPNVALRTDSKAAGRWSTNRNGEYFAIGTGGAVTGKGADLLIIDDPHSEQEATLAETSPEIYDKVYEWFTSGPRQRLQPGGIIIIVQTRWSKRDLVGQVLRASAQRGGDEWEVIEFPAILPSDNPLWPEFWSLKELQALKDELPNSKWMAQYQQNPTSDASAIVKREWWQVWEEPHPPPCDFVLMAADTAYEAHNKADYSAFTVWGVFYQADDNGVEQANIILLNAERDRIEFPELKRKTLELYKEWDPDAVMIEKKASGGPLIYELRAMGIPVQEFTPVRGKAGQSNDKIARLNAVSDIFASARVWAPNTQWAEEVIDEVASFPAGEHDDYVDTVSLALMRFRRGGFIRTTLDEEDEPVYQRKREYY